MNEILLHDNSKTLVQSYSSNNESLTQYLLDNTLCGANGGLVLTEETIHNLETLSRNWCFALHRSRSENLGLA